MALTTVRPQGMGFNTGRRNLIINGAMQVSQRGTSNTSFTLGYAVDRMYLDQFSASGGTHTYQQLSSDPPVNFRNYLRWQRNSGETATGAMRIYYTGETGASEGIAGNKLTLSFYARKGSNYSGGSLESRIVTGEGTNQTRSSWANGNWTNQVNDSQSNTLTTSWQRFTHTLASAAGNDVSQHALRFVWSPTGTAGADDYIEITGVQLELGENASDFEHRSFAEEWHSCQRYCTVYYIGGGGPHDENNILEHNSPPGKPGHVDVNNRGEWQLEYGPKRTAPTITFTDGSNMRWQVGNNGVVNANASPALSVGTSANSAIVFQGVASGITLGSSDVSHIIMGWLKQASGNNPKIFVDAEL